MEIKIAPSLDCADYTQLGRDVRAVAEGGADILHIDIMDGHFVPNYTGGPKMVKAVSSLTAMEIDVHLQMEEPDRCIEMFVGAGADSITFHAESTSRFFQTVDKIKAAGARASIAINPATPVEMVESILPRLDMIVVMCVDPGFAGQAFIAEAVSKIKKIRTMADEGDLNLDIQVDGNINRDTIPVTKEAGANVFILGTSSVFKTNTNIVKQTRYYKDYCQKC